MLITTNGIGELWSIAVVLMNPNIIAGMDAQAELTGLKKFSAKDLQKKMIDIGFKKEEISKANGKGYRPMKELHVLAETKLQELRKNQEIQIADEVARKLSAPSTLLSNVES